ncbi:hypothetical protein D3C72_1645210 [compost metagenome]
MTPLANVIRSGLMPNSSEPNQRPRRPKPQMTSSAISKMPYLSQMRWISGQYVDGGMMTPPAPCTGSPMKAATLSAPISRILSSSQPAAFKPKASGVKPWPDSR